jgi:gluconate 2-dehydrogenase alpha chain
VHDVEGLFVLGGATFPTCPGINTTETIQALAWRTAEYVAGSMAHASPLVALA